MTEQAVALEDYRSVEALGRALGYHGDPQRGEFMDADAVFDGLGAVEEAMLAIGPRSERKALESARYLRSEGGDASILVREYAGAVLSGDPSKAADARIQLGLYDERESASA